MSNTLIQMIIIERLSCYLLPKFHNVQNHITQNKVKTKT